MKRENLHQPFEISFSELDESLLKEHEHTFFELVYILSGTGIQWINNNMFPYHDGHLFMITPGDTHSFDLLINIHLFHKAVKKFFLLQVGELII